MKEAPARLPCEIHRKQPERGYYGKEERKLGGAFFQRKKNGVKTIALSKGG